MTNAHVVAYNAYHDPVVLRSYDGTEVDGLAVPLRSFFEALRAFARPADELTSRKPAFACPHCATPYEPGTDRCLCSGAQLPYTSGSLHRGEAFAAAERKVARLLSQMGHPAEPAPHGLQGMTV